MDGVSICRKGVRMHDRVEGQVIRYNRNGRFARLGHHYLCLLMLIIPHSRVLGEIDSEFRFAHSNAGECVLKCPRSSIPYQLSRGDRHYNDIRDLSRGEVVHLAAPDSTAVVKGSSTSDSVLLLQTELMMLTEVEDGG
jgi:hypothetical protein